MFLTLTYCLWSHQHNGYSNFVYKRLTVPYRFYHKMASSQMPYIVIVELAKEPIKLDFGDLGHFQCHYPIQTVKSVIDCTLTN